MSVCVCVCVSGFGFVVYPCVSFFFGVCVLAAQITTTDDGKDMLGKLKCSLFEKVYHEAVCLFLTKPTARHDLAAIRDLLDMSPVLAWLTVPAFATYIGKCRKALRFEQASTFIATLIRQKKFRAEVSESVSAAVTVVGCDWASPPVTSVSCPLLFCSLLFALCG